MRYHPQRIIIVGTSGSGKTTLAKALAARLGLEHVELDALHWEPNWQEASTETLIERVGSATAGGHWVIDGNYDKLRELTWRRADTIIWLDYSLPVTFGRVVKRTFKRLVSRQVLWSGNRESLWKTLFSRHSILFWTLTSHRRNQQRYARLLTDVRYRHLETWRFSSPGETDIWLAELDSVLAEFQDPVAMRR